LAIAIATLLLATGAAEAAGDCFTANIEEPFRLPDGAFHEGGKLTLCHERNHSPVAALHEVRIDRMGVGLFVSRRSVSEGLDGNAARPYLLFHRVNGGELFLIGVASPLRDQMQLYFLDDSTIRIPRKRTSLIVLANDAAFVLAPARTF
jgi:hypothetical protein